MCMCMCVHVHVHVGVYMCRCVCECGCTYIMYVRICMDKLIILLLNYHSIYDPMYLQLPPLCFLLSAKSKPLIISIATIV